MAAEGCRCPAQREQEGPPSLGGPTPGSPRPCSAYRSPRAACSSHCCCSATLSAHGAFPVLRFCRLLKLTPPFLRTQRSRLQLVPQPARPSQPHRLHHTLRPVPPPHAPLAIQLRPHFPRHFRPVRFLPLCLLSRWVPHCREARRRGCTLPWYARSSALPLPATRLTCPSSTGLVNELLSRICVPGVVLIATLSGGGAVNTAWEAYEWRSVSSRCALSLACSRLTPHPHAIDARSEPVTDSQISQAERALARTRLDLRQRHRSLALSQGSAAREAESAAGQSLLARWTSTSPAATQLKTLELEVSAMEKMERQMTHDVQRLKRRKAMRERGRSWKGRVWLAVGWLFSLYCVWRVFTVRYMPSRCAGQRYLDHQADSTHPRSLASTWFSATRARVTSTHPCPPKARTAVCRPRRRAPTSSPLSSLASPSVSTSS